MAGGTAHNNLEAREPWRSPVQSGILAFGTYLRHSTNRWIEA